MRRSLITVITGIAAAINAFPVCAADNEFLTIDGYRGYKWGTSVDTIYSREVTDDMAENEEWSKSDDSLSIRGMMFGSSAVIHYTLDENQNLYSGGYSIYPDQGKDVLSEYIHVIDLISSIYGTPDIDMKYDWSIGDSQDEEEDIDGALTSGEVSIATRWNDEDGNSIIYYLMGTGDGGTEELLFYQSEAFNSKFRSETPESEK